MLARIIRITVLLTGAKIASNFCGKQMNVLRNEEKPRVYVI